MNTKKYWWGKTTTQKVFTNHGWCFQVKSYLFGKKGLHFWTEISPMTLDLPETNEELLKLEELAAKIEVSKKDRVIDQLATMLEYNLYHNNPQH